jgi:hypothetical protein
LLLSSDRVLMSMTNLPGHSANGSPGKTYTCLLAVEVV